MGEFCVHRVRFHHYQPAAIHGLAYDQQQQKIALSRANGRIEIWNIKDDWYQEQVLPAGNKLPVEALLWLNGRLFAAAPNGFLNEYNLLTSTVKCSCPSNSAAIWCLCMNKKNTHIAAGTEDGYIAIFEILVDSIQFQKTLARQEGRILSIAWYDAGNCLVTGGVDNIRVWSLHSGRTIQKITVGRSEREQATYIWAIAVTNDLTIVSGDSRGKTCFWNGKHGTLTESLNSHKADVLSLAMNEDCTHVFCSGVDPNLVEFVFTPVSAGSDWKKWVRSEVKKQHTHDVKALIAIDNGIVSGGSDCHLILNVFDKGKAKTNKIWRRMGLIPHRPQAHLAKKAGVILLEYDKYIELWKLGSTSKNSAVSGEILPLSEMPVKLVQLLYTDGEGVLACAISSCAKWLVYTTSTTVRIYQLKLMKVDVASPKVTISRILNVPKSSLVGCRCVEFVPDSDMFVAVAPTGCVTIVSLDPDNAKIHVTLNPPTRNKCGCHLLAVSGNGKLIATADHESTINIYNLKKQKYLCTLPVYKHQPTAIGFHPTSSELIVAYSDQTMIEFHCKEAVYSTWSRQLNRAWHPQWLKRTSKITGIGYLEGRPHLITVYDDQMLCIIDKTQPLPEASAKLFNKSSWNKSSDLPKVSHAFHVCNKFKHLLHVSALDKDTLVMVERPPLAITEGLPPAFAKKMFGT